MNISILVILLQHVKWKQEILTSINKNKLKFCILFKNFNRDFKISGIVTKWESSDCLK